MAGRKRAEVAATGLAAELAKRLRALRDESGLTLRQLSVKSGFSASALSLAESGRAVPSWDLVAAFVQVCGQDPARWRQLWEVAQARGAQPFTEPAAQATPTSAASQTAGAQDASETAESTQRTNEEPGAAPQAGDRPMADAPTGIVRSPRLPLFAGAALVAIVVAAAVIFAATSSQDGRKPTVPAAQSRAAAEDGTDPYDDRCKADEKQLDWQPVLRPDHTTFGTILLMYSAACQAAWGYLDGPNSTAWTTHIIAHRVPGSGTAPSQFAGDAAYGSWGNVLSTRTGCVYIEAYLTLASGEGPHAKTACIQPVEPTVP